VEKNINIERLAKQYRVVLYPIEDLDGEKIEWGAEVPELPGCVGGGETEEEALAMVRDAIKAWLEVAIERGKKIPAPKEFGETEFSGKFTLRLPKSLHKILSFRAEEEGLSLNQYLLFLLTKNHYLEGKFPKKYTDNHNSDKISPQDKVNKGKTFLKS